MDFYKPSSLPDLFEIISRLEGRKYFLAGGSDINVQIKNKIITKEPVVYINHLDELRGVRDDGDQIVIGALTSYHDLISSPLLLKYIPFLSEALRYFASPPLQNMATIGGNLANGSPTADITPLLLVLNAELKMMSKSKLRIIPLNGFYTGYKQFDMKYNELIGAVIISKKATSGYRSYYRKVGSRRSLTIAKLSLAGLKKMSGEQIVEIRLAAGALNEYPRRLARIEDYLTSRIRSELDWQEIESLLSKEITPITDLRSDSEYRYQVCLNLIKQFVLD
ncbi:MAG: xanthine dehydrogenase family protein subunit M [Candidatus Cloacimonetes bacterium]|nr:xanthine dehydrogenase family protein subunit M [Candidatus Cloacimonadota bacterium]